LNIVIYLIEDVSGFGLRNNDILFSGYE
jgi:hypothetical protein